MEGVTISRKRAGFEDAASGYNAVKEFEGRKYTGMRVGGNHCWFYQQGEWNETKVAPDRWEFSYSVNKLRKWNAPEGSGAPVGTEYHWFILAHQNVRKLNANEYATSMRGVKYKLAHRRADSEEWSASERARLRRLIEIFEENIIQLRHELGEEMGEPEVVHSEAGPSTMGADRRWRAAAGYKRTKLRDPTLGTVLAQARLETYMAP
jgi:hypothetical protein